MIAMQELVVPKSIPSIFPMGVSPYLCSLFTTFTPYVYQEPYQHAKKTEDCKSIDFNELQHFIFQHQEPVCATAPQ
jgi:hypothetical protein